MNFQGIGVDREMPRGQMRITPHHFLRLPARHLLQREQGRSLLHMPRGPGVPQIVPTEVFDPRPLERLVPS